MKRCGRILVAVVLWSGMSAAAQANERVYEQVLPATAWVMAPVGLDKGSYGTGALIDRAKRWVVTNYHVVGEQNDVIVCFPTEVDGEIASQRGYYLRNLKTLGIRGRVIARNPGHDLALIALERLPSSARPVRLATRSASPGQHIQSIGNPGLSPALWVYTSGTVRQVVSDRWLATGPGRQYTFEAWVVLTQSAVNPGDSGSPVVNDRGELVAVVSGTGPGQQNSTCIDVREVRALIASVVADGNAPAVTDDSRVVPVSRQANPDQGRTPATAASLKATSGDPRLHRALGQSSLLFQSQPDGSYRVPFALPGGGTQDVIIADRCETSQVKEMRRIWALALVLNGPPSTELAIQLLRPRGVQEPGGWEIHEENGRFHVVYCVPIPADADGRTLLAAVTRVQEEAAALSQQAVARPASANR